MGYVLFIYSCICGCSGCSHLLAPVGRLDVNPGTKWQWGPGHMTGRLWTFHPWHGIDLMRVEQAAHLLRVELCPPKRKMYSSLTPGTCEWDLIWKWGPYRWTSVTLAGLGWAPKRRDKDTHTHTGHVKTEAEFGVMLSQARQRQGLPQPAGEPSDEASRTRRESISVWYFVRAAPGN